MLARCTSPTYGPVRAGVGRVRARAPRPPRAGAPPRAVPASRQDERMDEVVDGVLRLRLGYVNAYLVVTDDGLVLVDTGLPRSTPSSSSRSRMPGAPWATSGPCCYALAHGPHRRLARVQRASGARIVASAIDAPVVAGPRGHPRPLIMKLARPSPGSRSTLPWTRRSRPTAPSPCRASPPCTPRVTPRGTVLPARPRRRVPVRRRCGGVGRGKVRSAPDGRRGPGRRRAERGEARDAVVRRRGLRTRPAGHRRRRRAFPGARSRCGRPRPGGPGSAGSVVWSRRGRRRGPTAPPGASLPSSEAPWSATASATSSSGSSAYWSSPAPPSTTSGPSPPSSESSPSSPYSQSSPRAARAGRRPRDRRGSCRRRRPRARRRCPRRRPGQR